MNDVREQLESLNADLTSRLGLVRRPRYVDDPVPEAAANYALHEVETTLIEIQGRVARILLENFPYDHIHQYQYVHWMGGLAGE